MRDCLIIGYNDVNFRDFVKMIENMGKDNAEYKNLALNFIRYNGKPHRALEILTHFYYQDKNGVKQPFHNNDLLNTAVAYLGTYLSGSGFTFDYINLFHLEKERLKGELTKNNFLTVAITTTYYIYDLPIMEIISFIRKYNNTTKIIVGGPYISKRFETMELEQLKAFFKYLEADFYVGGREGEQALVNIIKALKSNGDFHHISSIAYKNITQYVITPQAAEINPLEDNMADYSLFPREDINGFVNLRFSKGCPYACAFCGFQQNARKYMTLGVNQIEKELNNIRELDHVSHLFFVDDTLNVPKRRFKDMLRMMIKENYDFKWHCFFRSDQGDEETIELMKEAGCQGVFLGLESANATVLKNMNKTALKEDYQKTIPLFKKFDIIVFVSIIIGFPGETYETFQETLDFLETTRPDFYRPQLWYCDVATPIWTRREKFALKGYNFGWSHKTMDAKTASDLFEKAFLSIDTPIWAPDLDFNFVSLYYLEQRGMSFQQQKRFLKCFNAVVKEQLLYPDKKEISPGLLKNLKMSCQFDQPAAPDMHPVEVFSGSSYTAAETFWVKEFTGNGK